MGAATAFDTGAALLLDAAATLVRSGVVSGDGQDGVMATSLLFGAGDLGTQIGFELAGQGDDVVAVRRRAELVPTPLTGLACDLSAGADAVCASLAPLDARPGRGRGPDRVVICLTPDRRDAQAYRATFVEAAGAALEAIERLGWAPERAVFVSSTAVCASEGDIDESTPAQPSTPTARVLAEAEKRFLDGLPVATRGIVVRPSGIYGPGREWFIERVRAGDIGDPARMTHRIHRDDLARAVAHLLTMPQQPEELYLVTDDEPAPAGQVATYVAELLSTQAAASWRDVKPQDRRISNARLCATGFAPTMPSYREGYHAVLGDEGDRHP